MSHFSIILAGRVYVRATGRGVWDGTRRGPMRDPLLRATSVDAFGQGVPDIVDDANITSYESSVVYGVGIALEMLSVPHRT